MKKYIILFLVLAIQSISIIAQNNSSVKDTSVNDCKYSRESVPIGVYDREYEYLTEEQYDTIIYKLNNFLKYKDIQVARKYNYALDAWNILMRIRVIKWTSHKMDIQNYLNNFLTQILNGDSYLNKENRNVLKDAFGCYYGYGDPARIPFACYWVSLKMDTTFGAKLIANTWEQIKIDEPFSNNLRSDLIRNVKPYYKNNSVQLILERIEKTNMTKIDNQRVQELKDKYEFFKTQNQPEAWRKLILRSHVQLTEDLYIGKQIWIKNIGILKEVFDNIDIKVPIELAELEKDVKIKYWLAYSCCYLGNNKYPNKLDGLLVQRIDKLISDIEIERTNSKNVIKNETNYLYEEYQTFKQWHN